MDWLPFLPQSISSQLWSTPEGLKPATDRYSSTQACTAKPSFLVQSDYGTPCQLMSTSCRLTTWRLNWTPSSWWNCRPAMFLIAPLDCFYLLLFGFLLSTTAVLTTSTAHTCTYTAVRYCSITELAPLLDEDEEAAGFPEDCLHRLGSDLLCWLISFCNSSVLCCASLTWTLPSAHKSNVCNASLFHGINNNDDEKCTSWYRLLAVEGHLRSADDWRGWWKCLEFHSVPWHCWLVTGTETVQVTLSRRTLASFP